MTDASPTVITLRPRAVLRLTLRVLGLLMLGHLAVEAIRLRTGPGHQILGFSRFFDMGSEANVPTYWSALLLLAAGGLLLLAADHARRSGAGFVAHWRFLGAGFLFMSLDEAAQVHERIIARVWGELFGRGEGITYYVWCLPVIPVVLLVGIAYLRFLRHLPRRTGALVVASAALFLGGALGFEMIESVLVSSGRAAWLGLSQLVEESLEMAGVSLFLYAVTGYLAERGASVLVRAG
jgi:hypothetical protein